MCVCISVTCTFEHIVYARCKFVFSITRMLFPLENGNKNVVTKIVLNANCTLISVTLLFLCFVKNINGRARKWIYCLWLNAVPLW